MRTWAGVYPRRLGVGPEPTAEQLEVGRRALEELLRVEGAGA